MLANRVTLCALVLATLACTMSYRQSIPAALPTVTAQSTGTSTPLPTLPPALPTPTETPAPYCIVTASNGAGGGSLYVRSGPGIQYQWVKVLQSGERLPMIDTEGDWVQIPGGWVSAHYVACNP